MEPKKHGIEETIEVLDLAFTAVNIGQQAYEDGKVNVSDFVLLFGLLRTLEPAIEGIEDIPNELADLDDEEAEQIIQHFSEKLDLDDDDVEGLIEDAFTFVISGVGFVSNLVNTIKEQARREEEPDLPV